MASFFWHNLKVKETEKILRANINKGLDKQEVGFVGWNSEKMNFQKKNPFQD